MGASEGFELFEGPCRNIIHERPTILCRWSVLDGFVYN